MHLDDDEEDVVTDIREQMFHNTVREHIVSRPFRIYISLCACFFSSDFTLELLCFIHLPSSMSESIGGDLWLQLYTRMQCENVNMHAYKQTSRDIKYACILYLCYIVQRRCVRVLCVYNWGHCHRHRRTTRRARGFDSRSSSRLCTKYKTAPECNQHIAPAEGFITFK